MKERKQKMRNDADCDSRISDRSQIVTNKVSKVSNIHLRKAIKKRDFLKWNIDKSPEKGVFKWNFSAREWSQYFILKKGNGIPQEDFEAEFSVTTVTVEKKTLSLESTQGFAFREREWIFVMFWS